MMFKPTLKMLSMLLLPIVAFACTAPPPTDPTQTPASSAGAPPPTTSPDTPAPSPPDRPTPLPQTESAAAETTNRRADADVLLVQATQGADGKWSFSVTVAHPDTGWEDYADGWDVVLPDGSVVKPNPDDPFTRLLLHPHETEQPFTRSQSNIEIPPGVTVVTVRAHDSVDGWGGQEIVVDLTQTNGAGFEVTR